MNRGMAAGFKHFQPPKEERDCAIDDLDVCSLACARHPSLVAALDQGPQSFPTVFFLQYELGLNFWFHYDPSHRVWNDVRDGMSDAGMFPFLVLSSLVMNLDHGPWDGR